MTFWQENYQFIKEIYEMRHTKMAEWMENVEKAISRIMADKVYTSAEFKRERDNFHVSKTNNWNVILAIINEIRGWSHSHAKAKIFEQWQNYPLLKCSLAYLFIFGTAGIR